MAKKSMILKQQAEPKFSTRAYNRCKLCGRPHSVLRKYGICRICFRNLAYKGEIPGVRKASWSTKFSKTAGRKAKGCFYHRQCGRPARQQDQTQLAYRRIIKCKFQT